MTAQPFRTLDPEQIVQLWFSATAGTVEVSWDDGVTWANLTPGTDPDGNTAQYLLIAGPDVAPSEAGSAVVLGPRGARIHGITRVVGNPQITPSRWHIDVKSPTATTPSTWVPPVAAPIIIDGGSP